jgi:hypothetical protein
MASMIVITCPECKKQLKGPAELQGKKIRCKSCNATFVVKAMAAGKTAAPATSKTAAPAAKAKSAAKSQPEPPKPARPPADDHPDDHDGKNPYKLTDVILSARCPQCAADMEEGDIICLHCGYNTQTRTRHTTVATYETTSVDYTMWLTPGVLCVVAVVALIGAIAFFWIPAALPALGKVGTENEAWWAHFSIRIYGSVMCAWLGWICGKFAFYRLIVNKTPPEKLKK